MQVNRKPEEQSPIAGGQQQKKCEHGHELSMMVQNSTYRCQSKQKLAVAQLRKDHADHERVLRKGQKKILIVDDDEKFLEVISQVVADNGYEVLSLQTSDEAFELLTRLTPDLVLCDVNLETSTMGGFSFYEKVRRFESLRKMPFIFLSGLTDEAIVRAGKQLGADDYLSKPICVKSLLATIRGKLERYEQLSELPRK